MAPSRFIAVFSLHAQRLFEAAEMLTPRVEVCPPDGVLLEIPARREQETLDRLTHLLDRDVRIGGASTRTAAILAARMAPGTLVPYHRESRFLAALPVTALKFCMEVEDALFETFAGWGIRTLGEVAALPRASLVARFGEKGAILQRLASGEDVGIRAGYQPEPEFKEEQELEWTLNVLEPLIFLLGGMLTRLCGRLKERGLAAESLCLEFRLDDGSSFRRELRPALPIQEAKILLSLLRLDLQTESPRSGVTGICIQARPAHPRIVQHSLLQPTAPHPEKLAQTLTRLKGILGGENVGSPRVLDTHRPDALHMEEMELASPKGRGKGQRKESDRPQLDRHHPHPEGGSRLALRRIRPPRPTRLCRETIVSCAGPWRTSGDWWTEGLETQAWARDEWDVELTDGVIYRVYWDHRKRQWYVEGMYD
ncbi:MAG: hypothetical protein P8020_10350 [Acidobacteriota bacterium]|jgi:protein ImuB